jgi:flagellar biosynthetic protein FliR
MSALLELYRTQFLLFTLILTRISGMVVLAPLFGSTFVPVRIRGFLAVAISLLITPLYWNEPFQEPVNNLQLATIGASELTVGLCLGLMLQILFSGLQVAGQVASQMSGMHLANTYDPSYGAEVSIFSRLMHMVALAVFVLIGGHRLALEGILDTFHTVPPGSGFVATGVVETLTAVLSQSFSLGLRVAAPAIVALLMSILVLGLISRTLPQLNVMIVGLSLNAAVMLAVFSVSLGAMAWAFQNEVEPTIDAFKQLFGPPHG